jgi:hypothetical protein
MLDFKILLALLTITAADWPFQKKEEGCCYSIGYAAFQEPCCLKTDEPKGQSNCLKNGDKVIGGSKGWNPTCPTSPKEANQWLNGVQANPINCPHTSPATGSLCSGSQDCFYHLRICPDGQEIYNSSQCAGKKTWDANAHVCLDGTEHYKVHALCVDGEWVISSMKLQCQDCLANLQTLGDAGSCALVTQGDAEVAAHNIYTCIVVGGTLTDGSPNEHAAVDGPAYVHQLGQPGRWNFNAGGPYSNASVDFARLQSLVSSPNLHNYTVDDYSVFVLTSGGTIHQGMFGGGDPENNGKTLVVFNTRDPITITSSDLGRQFGPSILAPFSDVTLLGKAGYIDGCVIAKSFRTAGDDAGQLQLHGDCYRGPLCSTKPFPPHPPRHNKWWIWIAGAAAGAAAAAVTIPLAVAASKHQTTPPPPVPPPPVEPCAQVAGYAKLYDVNARRDDPDVYEMGRKFGSEWGFTIFFALVVTLLIMLLAVARLRYRRERRDCRGTECFSQNEEGSEELLE